MSDVVHLPARRCSGGPVRWGWRGSSRSGSTRPIDPGRSSAGERATRGRDPQKDVHPNASCLAFGSVCGGCALALAIVPPTPLGAAQCEEAGARSGLFFLRVTRVSVFTKPELNPVRTSLLIAYDLLPGPNSIKFYQSAALKCEGSPAWSFVLEHSAVNRSSKLGRYGQSDWPSRR
jgi:hypothetical protein